MSISLKKEMTGFPEKYMYIVRIISGAIYREYSFTASEIRELNELLNKEELL